MNNELANIVKKNRIKKNYSQQQLANIIGVSKSYINKMEHGNTKQPNINILNRLATELEIDFVDLAESANYDIEDIIINETLIKDFIYRYEATHDNDIIFKYIKNKQVDISQVIKDYENEKISNIDATYLFILWTDKTNTK